VNLKIVKNRAEPILHLVKGKDVLEIGCVGMGKHDTIGGKNFIAGYVMPISRKWVGVDINEKGVYELCKKGFNALVIDVEKPFDLGQKFDVILAEEVLEHLSDLPTFFENVKKHLKENGLFIITTPKPYFSFLLHAKIARWKDQGCIHRSSYVLANSRNFDQSTEETFI